MRNSGNGTTINVTRSSARTNHHSQLLTQADIADGYDFNRARSTESTENALAGKVAAPSEEAVGPLACCETEGRGVPVSPKKLPPTPPRDNGSPSRPIVHCGLGNVLRQPFLPTASAPSKPFLRPSSWRRQKEKNHDAEVEFGVEVPSIFRTSSPGIASAVSREDDSYYVIQRSLAFDDDDDDEDQELE